MSDPRNPILVVSHDPVLADVRKHILEGAGFKVISATNLMAVRDACVNYTLSLVMIGYSLPAAEKRRVWSEVRQACSSKTPVLELYDNDKPELMESQALFSHESHEPKDFLEAVQQILSFEMPASR